jgi:NitT/TauT family transport system substrate-binding protein
MNDLLHAKQLDAALPAEPFLTQITQSGSGALVSYYTDSLPVGTLTFTWVAMADYAKAHPDVIAGFRAAVDEALAYYAAHPESRAPTLAKFTKIPLAVLEKTPPAPYDNTVDLSHTAFWVDVMTKQKLLLKPIDAASLLIE